jgi:hypothetical protein
MQLLSLRLAGSFPQSSIDAILPAWAFLLEVLQHILINAKGNRLFDARDSGRLGQFLDWFRGRFLEGRFSSL